MTCWLNSTLATSPPAKRHKLFGRSPRSLEAFRPSPLAVEHSKHLDAASLNSISHNVGRRGNYQFPGVPHSPFTPSTRMGAMTFHGLSDSEHQAIACDWVIDSDILMGGRKLPGGMPEQHYPGTTDTREI